MIKSQNLPLAVLGPLCDISFDDGIWFDALRIGCYAKHQAKELEAHKTYKSDFLLFLCLLMVECVMTNAAIEYIGF